jgi:hypothetical protein
VLDCRTTNVGFRQTTDLPSGKPCPMHRSNNSTAARAHSANGWRMVVKAGDV